MNKNLSFQALFARLRALPRRRLLLMAAAALVGLALCVALLGAVAVALVSRQLPDVATLDHYQPKLPLRVYTSDGALIGEFGEERRELVSIDKMPRVLKDAVLAAEDARFYKHGGVDRIGLARALLANLSGRRAQGASTITMQVARNMFLSSERTFSRKLKEVLLAQRLEGRFTKDQILEIYLNQIYLGNRAYGFAAAAQTYFGKPVQALSVAEAAMLAGLPKSPSGSNPFSNLRRSTARQQYIIGRMVAVGYLSPEDALKAKAEPLKLRDAGDPARVHAEYAAEWVRQQMVERFGEAAYTRGLRVETTVIASEQNAAYSALRKSIMDYESRQPWRGPEALADLPEANGAATELADAVDDALAEHPDHGDLVAAVVLEASPKKIVALRASGERIDITGKGLQRALPGLAGDKAAPNLRVQRGSVLRLQNNPGKGWEVAPLPEVEGAFVAMDPRNGSVHALVGGFDFNKNKFNHVTQAWRQPGSSFKPFIYSAALEKGFSPATVVNDAPLLFDTAATGGKPWEPKNYDGSFAGPMSLRQALAQSKNMVTLRVLQNIGTPYAQEWIRRFGFEPDKHPAYLTMGLGAGSVTPMQMASAYSVFANGGLSVKPILITKITDAQGTVIEEMPVTAAIEDARAISARNAFVMSSLLGSVVKSGTARRAHATLRRDDLYGKTGTTNDSFDAWFAGYQPTRVGIAWIGYDTPRQLGQRGETGGSVALPVWTGYMQGALKGVAIAALSVPTGLTDRGGDWAYDEYADGQGVQSLGLESDPTPPDAEFNVPPGPEPYPAPAAPASPPTSSRERNRILDLFR